MKDIGYKDVETYVRTMISEGFGSKAEDNKIGALKGTKEQKPSLPSCQYKPRRTKKKKRTNVEE